MEYDKATELNQYSLHHGNQQKKPANRQNLRIEKNGLVVEMARLLSISMLCLK
jgi:hypothetical protein